MIKVIICTKQKVFKYSGDNWVKTRNKHNLCLFHVQKPLSDYVKSLYVYDGKEKNK